MNDNDLFILICAFFVFLMQPGFVAFEAGLARAHHALPVALKNLMDWALTTIVFGFVGLGLMYGTSRDLIGTSGFGFDLAAIPNTTSLSTGVFILFQLGFAGTAVTIVSGALIERISFPAYLCVSVAVAGLIYPIAGHWVWGGTLTGDDGWLAGLGYTDFAGASLVHVIGAVVALVGVLVVGPRLGRFDADGNINTFESSSPAMSTFGVVILWIGWWAFNGGSTLSFNEEVAMIILVTNIAGAGGLFGGALYRWRSGGQLSLIAALVGGCLAGLVAITAGANVLGPWSALLLGLAAGWLFGIGHDLCIKLQIDDALMAFPVHGLGGGLGIVATPLLARSGSFDHGRLAQTGIQLGGIVIVGLWAAAISFIVFAVLRKTIGLRIAPRSESGAAPGAAADTGEDPYRTFNSDWADLL